MVKLIGMARSPIASAMAGKTIGKSIDNSDMTVYIERFGKTRDDVFVTSSDLRVKLGDKEFENLPTGAICLYSYYARLAQGLGQFMCGSRKSTLDHITRDDIVSLTRKAADVSGIQHLKNVDEKEQDNSLLIFRAGRGNFSSQATQLSHEVCCQFTA